SGSRSESPPLEPRHLPFSPAALSEKPHIRVREPLESGHPTELACSLPVACEGGRPLTFSWAGAAVDSLDPQNLSSSVLTFTPRPQDHGTNLTCQVKREWPQLTTQRTIQLNVSYAPQNLTIGVSFRNNTAFKNLQTTSLTVLEGEALRLRCKADSNPPAELSWFRGSPGLKATPISSTAILELPRVGPAQEGEFTCQARHPLGSHSVSLSLSVACEWGDPGGEDKLSPGVLQDHGQRQPSGQELPSWMDRPLEAEPCPVSYGVCQVHFFSSDEW
ncbi:PREDICTED: sialic acid-binding Ig-like lectin 5, partial [Myotis davidii]|uniref:sialic acid-binding Ig-like lectin 5 n=1 Tax=Myotis davidii TaxID=225400 RepID=UPI0007674B73